MTITFLTALLVQFVMVVLLRHRLGPRWLRRPVTVFVLASVVYQGIAPVLLAIPSVGKADIFRLGIQRAYIDSADLIMSATMLAFTLGYLLTRPERTATRELPSDITVAAKVLDWRWLALACVPLTLFTAEGRGYNGGVGSGPGTSLSTDLVVAFSIIMVVVTATGFLLRHGTRWFLPVLIVQSGVLAIAGERTPVIMDAIALILVLLFVGVHVPGRQVMAAVILTALVILSITGVRAQRGRDIFYASNGVSSRVSALATGLSSGSGSPDHGDSGGLVAQFAVRMSSVDFGGAVLQAISEGQPRLSPVYVPESLLLVVPSFLWPAKLAQGTALSPGSVQIDAFGLQNINFLSGVSGLYIGFLSPTWLMTLFGGLGIMFGWFERWLLRARTPARMVLLVGAVVAALRYESGLPAMLVEMRSAAALALLVWAVLKLRFSRISRDQELRTIPWEPCDPDGGLAGGHLARLGHGRR